MAITANHTIVSNHESASLQDPIWISLTQQKVDHNNAIKLLGEWVKNHSLNECDHEGKPLLLLIFKNYRNGNLSEKTIFYAIEQGADLIFPEEMNKTFLEFIIHQKDLFGKFSFVVDCVLAYEKFIRGKIEVIQKNTLIPSSSEIDILNRNLLQVKAIMATYVNSPILPLKNEKSLLKLCEFDYQYRVELDVHLQKKYFMANAMSESDREINLQNKSELSNLIFGGFVYAKPFLVHKTTSLTGKVGSIRDKSIIHLVNSNMQGAAEDPWISSNTKESKEARFTRLYAALHYAIQGRNHEVAIQAALGLCAENSLLGNVDSINKLLGQDFKTIADWVVGVGTILRDSIEDVPDPYTVSANTADNVTKTSDAKTQNEKLESKEAWITRHLIAMRIAIQTGSYFVFTKLFLQYVLNMDNLFEGQNMVKYILHVYGNEPLFEHEDLNALVKQRKFNAKLIATRIRNCLLNTHSFEECLCKVFNVIRLVMTIDWKDPLLDSDIQHLINSEFEMPTLDNKVREHIILDMTKVRARIENNLTVNGFETLRSKLNKPKVKLLWEGGEKPGEWNISNNSDQNSQEVKVSADNKPTDTKTLNEVLGSNTDNKPISNGLLEETKLDAEKKVGLDLNNPGEKTKVLSNMLGFNAKSIPLPFLKDPRIVALNIFTENDYAESCSQMDEIYRAILEENVERVKKILENNTPVQGWIDFSFSSRKKFTPLMLACLLGNVPICEVLLKAEASLTEECIVGSNHITPFFMAILSSNLNLIKKMLYHKASLIVTENSQRILPIMWAAGHGKRSVFELFYNDDPEKSRSLLWQGRNIFHLAVIENNIEVMDFLLACSLNDQFYLSRFPVSLTDNSIQHRDSFLYAINNNFEQIVYRLAQRFPALVNSKEACGCGMCVPISHAANNSTLEIVKILVEAGARNVPKLNNSKSRLNFGQTQSTEIFDQINSYYKSINKLVELAYHNDATAKDLKKLLLQVPLTLQLENGNTLLHLTLRQGYPVSTRTSFALSTLLVELGANILAKNDQGETPIECASSYELAVEAVHSYLYWMLKSMKISLENARDKTQLGAVKKEILEKAIPLRKALLSLTRKLFKQSTENILANTSHETLNKQLNAVSANGVFLARWVMGGLIKYNEDIENAELELELELVYFDQILSMYLEKYDLKWDSEFEDITRLSELPKPLTGELAKDPKLSKDKNDNSEQAFEPQVVFSISNTQPLVFSFGQNLSTAPSQTQSSPDEPWSFNPKF